MKYIEVKFRCFPNTESIDDILAAELAEIGFDSFVQTVDGLLAYIPQNLFSIEKTDKILSSFPLDVQFSYSFNDIEDKNWNEEWEKNFFQPIVFGNSCIIHSSFHQPEGKYDYQILIDPKMAFGTGHHQTTGLVLEEILSMDLKDKKVLDMGCGTAVLAILASMRGAKQITAIDIDEWAYNNAVENVKLNNINNIKVEMGGAELLGKETFDIILANINRNILLQDIPIYAKVLNPNGLLIMSGFYNEDIPIIREKCEQEALSFCHKSEKENWVSVVCKK